ncbi:MAG: hypothetical protein IPL88_12045 [Rhizobiales bacterium]|nr:hypothetical protein [Hyphomicrobiales bacterium]
MSTAADPSTKTRWPRALRWGLVALGVPFLAYLPGFVLALPVGFATSLPFWGDAKDYSCSSSRASSLIVRVSPYVDPQSQPRAGDDWGCRRIDVLSDADLGEGRATRGLESSYYVRVYTPAARPQVNAPMMGAGAPIQAQTITIVRQAREGEAVRRAP